MTEVVYCGPLPGVVLPDGLLCESGSPVAVDAETAENLKRSGVFKDAPKKEKADK